MNYDFEWDPVKDRLNRKIMVCDSSKRRMFSVTQGPSRCLMKNTAKLKIAG